MDKSGYRYTPGGEHWREAVEFDIWDGDELTTTCVVDVESLMMGHRAFSCGNGDDYRLNHKERLEILELVQAERKKIADRFPVKTFEGWYASGLPEFSDYCQVGDVVDEEMVDHFINSFPPVLMWTSCTQAGEPESHVRDENGKLRPTFATFHEVGSNRWAFDGYCFYKENINRVKDRSVLERAIEREREAGE